MSGSVLASQIKLIEPGPAMPASDRGAAGANLSAGVMQVRGDAGPMIVASATLSTGRTSKQRSTPNSTFGITSSVLSTGCGVSGAGSVIAYGSAGLGGDAFAETS